MIVLVKGLNYNVMNIHEFIKAETQVCLQIFLYKDGSINEFDLSNKLINSM